MLGKFLAPCTIGPLNILKLKFDLSISWKKIKDKVFERQKYYKDYEMQSSSLRIDQEKYKIYITPRSPEVIRIAQSTYRILGNEYNFNLTFLQNLDYMGKQFTWSNRKSIGIGFRDILQIQTVTPSAPIIISKEFFSTYNNETSRTVKQLKVQALQDNQTIKLSLSIHSQNDGDKWLGVYELSYNDYDFLIQSAKVNFYQLKKNIYYASGLKTMIELQKRQIVRLMDKRVINNQQKQLKSSIQYDVDKDDLLSEMGEYESEETKSKK